MTSPLVNKPQLPPFPYMTHGVHCQTNPVAKPAAPQYTEASNKWRTIKRRSNPTYRTRDRSGTVPRIRANPPGLVLALNSTSYYEELHSTTHSSELAREKVRATSFVCFSPQQTTPIQRRNALSAMTSKWRMTEPTSHESFRRSRGLTIRCGE